MALLVVMVFPQAGADNTMTQNHFLGLSQQAFVYDFSNMAVGSLPSNNSWITFNTSGGSNISYSVQDFEGMNGLNVLTDSLSVASFLNITMKVPSGYSLNINFSWSDQQNGAFTEDNLLISNSTSTNSTTIRFGPLHGYRTQIIQGSTIVYHERDIPFNGDSLNLSPSTFPQTEEYCTLGYGNAEFLPVSIPGANFSGNTSVLIGGEISNLTVYQISLHRDYSYAFIAGAETPSEIFSQIPGWMVKEASWNESLLRPEMNTILIPCYNGSVFGFNYENMTFFRITGASLTGNEYSPVGSFLHNGTAYFLFSGLTGSHLVSVENNLSYTVHSYNGSIAGSSIIFGRDSGFVAFSPASVMIFSYSFKPLGNTTIPFYLHNYTIISTTSNQGEFSAILSNFSSESIAKLNDSGVLTVQNYTFPAMEFGENITVLKTMVSNGNLSSAFLLSQRNQSYNSLAYEFNGTLFFSGMGEIIPLAGTQELFSSSGGFTFSSLDFIPFSSGGSSLTAVAGTDQGDMTIAVYGSEIAVMRTGPGGIITGGMSVSFPASIHIRGNDSQNFTINSTSPFLGTLSFNGHSFSTTGDSLQIMASNIPSGNYTGEFNVTSEQGFEHSQIVSIVVDNYYPVFTVSRTNHSYLSAGTEIYYNVSEPWLIASASATFSGVTESVPADGNITFSDSNISGNISLNFTFSDYYGTVFQYTYFYDAVILYTDNFSCNLQAGYVAVSSQEVKWTNLSWASYYTVTVNSVPHVLFRNSTTIQFSEGSNNILISAESISGVTVALLDANVTRIDYPPLLSFTAPAGEYYSFFGNSNNHTLVIEASTNITGNINMRVTREGVTEFSENFTDSVNVTFTARNPLFFNNGNYSIILNASSESGTYSISEYDFEVNNTIPSIPPVLSELYTNSTEFTIFLPFGYYYSLNLSDGQYYLNESSEGGIFPFTLPFMDTIYSLNATITSLTGNENSTVVKITAFNLLPVITLTAQKETVIESPSDLLSYSVSDPINLSSITLSRNGIAVGNYSTLNGSISVSFTSNGYFNFTLLATDKCSNSNSSQQVAIQDLYYTNVVSAAISASSIFSFWSFSAGLSGTVTPEVQVHWMVNGHRAGNGTSIRVDLPVGKNSVEMIVIFDGKETVTDLAIYNYGYLALVAPLAGLSAWGLLYMFAGDKSEAGIRSIIFSSRGKLLRDISRDSRRQGHNRVAFKRVLRESIKGGGIVLMDDPDGNLYVMDPKS